MHLPSAVGKEALSVALYQGRDMKYLHFRQASGWYPLSPVFELQHQVQG